jgi:lysyl-tRNA synthetase class II
LTTSLQVLISDRYISAPEFVKGSRNQDKSVRISGRVMSKREASKKLYFYDLHASEMKVQVMATHQSYTDHAKFNMDNEILKRGDVVGLVSSCTFNLIRINFQFSGVEGFPARTKTGELSIIPRSIVLLSPCLHHLPETGHLKDIVLFSGDVKRIVDFFCFLAGNSVEAAIRRSAREPFLETGLHHTIEGLQRKKKKPSATAHSF